MMEKIKNAMKNGLVNGSCDSFGATSVGSSSERSRSGSDEARTATGRAGRAGRAVGGARGGAKAAAEPASRANVTFMLPASAMRFGTDLAIHIFFNCAANERTERCATSAVPC